MTIGFDGVLNKVANHIVYHKKPSSGLSHAEKHGKQIGASIKKSSIYHPLHGPLEPEQRQIHELRKLKPDPALQAPSFAYEDQKIKQPSAGFSWHTHRSNPSNPLSRVYSPNLSSQTSKNQAFQNEPSIYNTIRHDPLNPLKSTFTSNFGPSLSSNFLAPRPPPQQPLIRPPTLNLRQVGKPANFDSMHSH